MNDAHVIELWRLLRTPFVLPRVNHGTCNWETIDLGLLGCTVCGQVHRCHYDTCQTVGTECGEVCILSGVAVKTVYFPEDEYMETMNLESNMRNPNLFNEHDHHAIVKQSVHEILTSSQAKKVHALQILKRLEKSLSIIRTPGSNILNKAFSCCKQFELHKKMPKFDLDARQALAKKCSHHVLYLLTKLVREFRMSLRINEIKSVVYGMLYLMRNGVQFDGICILKRFEELNTMLPTEVFLQKCVGLKPKLITDTENRIKFCLRNMSKSTLKSHIYFNES